MREYSIFNKATGQGVKQGNCSDRLRDQQYDPATETIFEGEFATTHWYDQANDILVAKTPGVAVIDTLSLTPGGTSTITGVPAGSVASTSSGPVPVDDGTLTVTADTTGTYRIVMQHPKHEDQDWEIQCDE